MTLQKDLNDRQFMLRALILAEQGRGRVHPNPLVGAVIVKNGKGVGEGAHRWFGGPHAEVAAGRNAKGGLAGATMMFWRVTLALASWNAAVESLTGGLTTGAELTKFGSAMILSVSPAWVKVKPWTVTCSE